MRKILAIAAACLTMMACKKDDGGVPDNGSTTTFARGKGVVSYTGYAPLASRPINIHYFIPSTGDMKTMPVLLVFPGTNRNAADYMTAWIPDAQARGVMVFALEFPSATYTASQYIEGGMYSGSTLLDRSQWTFSVIEPIFDFINTSTGSSRTKYDIWGHSAGAQFVHRFVLFNPTARVDRAVSSNAGWYTLPDATVAYPYGLKNTPFGTADVLKSFFARHLIVHLGTADLIRDSDLNTTAGAEAQGANRYARGTYFYARSLQIQSAGGWPLSWEKVETPGVAHEYKKMAVAAAAILY